MRLFQIKVNEISDYSWTLDNGDYHARYTKEREEAVIKIKEQADTLARLGVTFHEHTTAIVTADQLINLTVEKVEYKLIKEIPLNDDNATDLNGVMRKFNRMAAKLMSLPGLQRSDHHHDCQNERIHVHMPGQALSTYNRVQLLENVCTDELQRSIDAGWRIIAACPQPDARRPDYILGRYEPDRDVTDLGHNRASRGE